MDVGDAKLPRRVVQSAGLDLWSKEFGLRLGVWH